MVEWSMKKKHIITVAGRPGSGKSTTSKMLAECLGYERFSSGDFFRLLGRERGMDVKSANIDAEKGQSDIDAIVDQKLRDLGEQSDNMVIDSRTAWHWIPNSFKVYLNLDIHIAVKRILSKIEPERLKSENIPDNPVEYEKALDERYASESRRYQALYNIDPSQLSNYDLVIDTATNDPKQVIKIIIDAYERWLGDVN